VLSPMDVSHCLDPSCDFPDAMVRSAMNHLSRAAVVWMPAFSQPPGNEPAAEPKES